VPAKLNVDIDVLLRYFLCMETPSVTRPSEALAFHATTREAWLHAGIESMRPLFLNAGNPLPGAVHVSVGFPSVGGLARKRRRLGECWSSAASKDGNHHIFVSPLLNDAIEILDVLTHELVHSAVGTPAGHGPVFRRAALALGLQGPMRSATAGPDLRAQLAALATRLGDLPHAGLFCDPTRKKQSTRLLKVDCPDCGYVARITARWIAAGLPTCPCGEPMHLNVAEGRQG
jgi:hypothetical protein